MIYIIRPSEPLYRYNEHKTDQNPNDWAQINIHENTTSRINLKARNAQAPKLRRHSKIDGLSNGQRRATATRRALSQVFVL